MFSAHSKWQNHKWFIPLPHNIIPHEDLNWILHWKNIQIPLAILLLNNKKFSQVSSVVQFPWFCFFLYFSLLLYQPFPMLTPLCLLLPEPSFFCRWSSNLLHPLYTPLGDSLGISSVCFPPTPASPSWIFVSSPLFRDQNSSSLYVQLGPRARGRLNYFSFPFLFFTLCESEAQTAVKLAEGLLRVWNQKISINETYSIKSNLFLRKTILFENSIQYSQWWSNNSPSLSVFWK